MAENMQEEIVKLNGEVLGMQLVMMGMVRALVRTPDDRQYLMETLQNMFNSMELRIAGEDEDTRSAALTIKEQTIAFLQMISVSDPTTGQTIFPHSTEFEAQKMAGVGIGNLGAGAKIAEWFSPRR